MPSRPACPVPRDVCPALTDPFTLHLPHSDACPPRLPRACPKACPVHSQQSHARCLLENLPDACPKTCSVACPPDPF
ncbi:hypothetical protein Dimus_031348, partial [Dionaea muscipula]